MHIETWSGLWFAWTIPAIVLLYLFKRKYTDTEVSSHLLWRRVLRDPEANRPFRKIRRSLLLMLQLLIAALLVLTLLHPFVRIQGMSPVHYVLVLDGSASMLALADGDGLGQSGAGAGGGDPGQPGAGESDSTRQESSAGIGTAAGKTRFDEAKQKLMQTVRRAAGGSKFTVIATGREPMVLAAGETSVSAVEAALRDVRPFPGNTAYRETLSLAASIVRSDPQAQLRFITDGRWALDASLPALDVPLAVDIVAGPENDNVSVLQFGVKNGGAADAASAFRDGGAVDGVATVKNWGAREANVDVALYVQERLQEVRSVRLAPGEQKSVFFSGLPQGDYYRLSLDASDMLREDNAAYAFAENKAARTALWLGPGNLFLEKALKLAQTDVIKAQKDESGQYVFPASRIDFVVLAGVRKEEIASRDWQSYLAARPVWTIGAAGGEDKIPLAVRDYAIEDHPVTRFIRFQDVHIAEAYRQPAPEWGKPIVSAGTVPLVFAGTERGQARLQFAFDLQASDLPLRPEFPVLVRNAADWLGAVAGGNLGRVVAGETIDIALSPLAVQAAWVAAERGLSAPSGEIPLDRPESGAHTVPDQPGLYRLVEKDDSGVPVQIRYLEVYMDPRESDLSLRENTGEAEEQPGDSGRPAALPAGLKPYSLNGWIVLLIMLLCIAEWEVYRRGDSF